MGVNMTRFEKFMIAFIVLQCANIVLTVIAIMH